MTKKVLRTALVLLAAAAITTGAYLHFRPANATAATDLTTATVTRGSLSATISAAGNIQAHQAADLSFGQSGTVKAINVAEGDSVKAGDVPCTAFRQTRCAQS